MSPLSLLVFSAQVLATLSRGIQYGYNPIGVDVEPRCGQRFGGALLGRGHGRDLDSDSEYGELSRGVHLPHL